MNAGAKLSALEERSFWGKFCVLDAVRICGAGSYSAFNENRESFGEKV